MSLSFVVQQTLRLMNPPPPTGTAALTADEAMVTTTPTGLPASAASDAGGASDESAATATAIAAEVEGQVWSRLRDFEAEEAQSINQRLVTRHQRTHHHDTYTPDGELLFTERYIQRYLEEEERAKRESADWTRNLDSSTARFRAGAGGEFKESDAAMHRHYDTTHVSGGDEEEGGDYNHYYDNAASDDRLGAGGSASHHSVRSSLSSVGRALGRKVKHSSSKIASSLGNAGRRAHHRGRDKGKEAAATGAAASSSAWPDYSAVAADYGYVSPSFDLAGIGGLGVVPGTTMAGEEERSFPLFSAGVGGVGPSSSSAAGGDFGKSWERDYSPFSTYAFDQRAPQPANASSFAYDDGDDDDDGDDELPPLESLDP